MAAVREARKPSTRARLSTLLLYPLFLREGGQTLNSGLAHDDFGDALPGCVPPSSGAFVAEPKEEYHEALKMGWAMPDGCGMREPAFTQTLQIMALWEYKVITSGKGGFASATMLESYLNQLGKDEWEIIDFRADVSNSLVFNGLVRRPTQREWTLEAAVAAAAKAEADKLRAELMHKQHAGDASASADAPEGASAGDKAAGPDSLRRLRDTDRDHDP